MSETEAWAEPEEDFDPEAPVPDEVEDDES